VVCATHRNLQDRIQSGDFREDLFYRLSEMVLQLTPLRQRIGDAELLAHAFVHRFGQANGRSRLKLREDALQAIARHPWPGNVRELENAIKRAVIMADEDDITAEDLGLNPAADEPVLTLRDIRDQAERDAVIRAMARSDDNVARAAELLGISRPTLYDLLTRYGLRAS
jgi:two-component system NtrC family response regulator